MTEIQETEIWKDITDSEGFYQVSSHGRVRSVDRYAKVCGGGERFVKGIIYTPGSDKDGYSIVVLSKEGKKYPKKIHRLVASAFLENPENKGTINHKDCIKTNNFKGNLEWATQLENIQYSMKAGTFRAAKGEQAGKSIPKEKAIAVLNYPHLPQRKVAEILGINSSTVWSIRNGKHWALPSIQKQTPQSMDNVADI